MRACRDELLSPRRYRRTNQPGGAVRERHRASDRGKARLLALRLGDDCAPPVGVKVINSWTMCWPSIHRLAESPGVPTTVIVSSAHWTVISCRPFPGGASATAGNAGNATAAAVNAPSARSRFMCFPFDEVAVGIHYPAGNVIRYSCLSHRVLVPLHS